MTKTIGLTKIGGTLPQRQGGATLSKHHMVSDVCTWASALEDYLFFKQSQARKESTLKDIEQKVSQFFWT